MGAITDMLIFKVQFLIILSVIQFNDCQNQKKKEKKKSKLEKTGFFPYQRQLFMAWHNCNLDVFNQK